MIAGLCTVLCYDILSYYDSSLRLFGIGAPFFGVS